MKTVIIQSYRDHDVPAWIARCLASVKAWAASQGHDHWMTGDESFALCGPEYLAAVGTRNKRSITNLSRLELIRQAHQGGYDRAIWIDADIFVFAPERFAINLSKGYAFARETYLNFKPDGRWNALFAVNNSVMACMAGEPDLDLIIQITRHVARTRKITSNYQVGGDIIKGLWSVLKFPTLNNVGMFSPYIVGALARGHDEMLALQARQHKTPVWAANLCGADHYESNVSEQITMQAIDALESTRGGVINDRLSAKAEEAQPKG